MPAPDVLQRYEDRPIVGAFDASVAEPACVFGHTLSLVSAGSANHPQSMVGFRPIADLGLLRGKCWIE